LWLQAAHRILFREGGVAAVEHGDQDHVPVVTAEMRAIPRISRERANRTLASVIVCGRANPSARGVQKTREASTAKRVEHCLDIAARDASRLKVSRHSNPSRIRGP
jgi:hypothetical protein